MSEEDYFIRSFRSKVNSNLQLEERQNMMNFNSMSYSSFGAFGMSLPSALNNRKSISMTANPHNQKHLR
jgi:hypothetical protein